MDEAHNIVDSATAHFTLRVSNRGILKTLNRLKRTAARSARIMKETRNIKEQSPAVKNAFRNGEGLSAENKKKRRQLPEDFLIHSTPVFWSLVKTWTLTTA